MIDDAESHRYRTFWRRFWSGLIDAFVLWPITWIDDWMWTTFTSPLILVPWWILDSSAYVAYSVLLHGYTGQTIGKRLMGVKVYDVSGAKLSLKQAVLRDCVYIAVLVYGLMGDLVRILEGKHPFGPDRQMDWGIYIAMYAMLGWFVVELVTMLSNAKRRAIHDFIAGSVVVRVNTGSKS